MDWTRSGRTRTHEVTRVRVFLDHWEFARSCQTALAELKGRKITPKDVEQAQTQAQLARWDKLARSIMGRLDMIEYIADAEKEMRAVEVYASVSPKDDGTDNPLRVWLREFLDRLPGYNVHQTQRTYDDPETCRQCGEKIEPEVEKGLKTKVACDILSWAVEDLYDVGVLVMDDPELIPSILCVQEVLDKQIVHVGLKRNGEQVRSAAWGHVLLEDLLPDLFPDEEWRGLFLARTSA